MTQQVALAATGLRKSFGKKIAVEDVNLSVKQGEIAGFLGPNGAGKTTVMNMIMGLVEPEQGSIEILGVRDGQRKPDIRIQIGFLQEKPHIYPEMTVCAYLDFFGRLYGISNPKSRISDVLERVGLRSVANRRLGTFSRGMQQRACLARVMLHQPKLLILDEPTLGLDPNGVAEMRTIFREMKADGVTLLFSSHQLAEMERVCDSVIFMNAGQVVASGKQTELIPPNNAEQFLTVELFEPAAEHLTAIRQIDGFGTVRESGTNQIQLMLALDGNMRDRRAHVAKALTAKGLTVLSVNSASPSLEDLFLGLTNKSVAQSMNT